MNTKYQSEATVRFFRQDCNYHLVKYSLQINASLDFATESVYKIILLHS